LRFWVVAEIPLIFKAVGLFPDVFNSAGIDPLSFRDAVVRIIAIVEFRFVIIKLRDSDLTFAEN
jgi:hypothetical protein